jgi:hypothetical protein
MQRAWCEIQQACHINEGSSASSASSVSLCWRIRLWILLTLNGERCDRCIGDVDIWAGDDHNLHELWAAWQTPLPKSHVLIAPEWHHTIASLSLEINELFMLLAPELVVDVVGTCRADF